MILLYKNAEEKERKLFRTYLQNYGCLSCLENDRYNHCIDTDTLFFKFLKSSKCQDCYVYKMHLELETYKNMEKVYVDDGK